MTSQWLRVVAKSKHVHRVHKEAKRGRFGSVYLVEQCKCGFERTCRAIPDKVGCWKIGRWHRGSG